MLWVLNRIICLDNFNAFLILTSKNQILKLSSAVVQPHLCWTKTLSVWRLYLHRWTVITCKAFWRDGFLASALPFPLSSLIFDVESLRALKVVHIQSCDITNIRLKVETYRHQPQKPIVAQFWKQMMWSFLYWQKNWSRCTCSSCLMVENAKKKSKGSSFFQV